MSEETPGAYYVRRREFLNEDPDLPAFIIGIVEDARAIPDDQPKEWASGYIALDFADCYRRVCFNFDMDGASERANSLRKINLIAEVVNAVRDGIAQEVESRNARPEPAEVAAAPPKTEVEPARTEVEPTRVETEPASAENSTAQFSTSYTLGL